MKEVTQYVTCRMTKKHRSMLEAVRKSFASEFSVRFTKSDVLRILVERAHGQLQNSNK